MAEDKKYPQDLVGLPLVVSKPGRQAEERWVRTEELPFQNWLKTRYQLTEAACP